MGATIIVLLLIALIPASIASKKEKVLVYGMFTEFVYGLWL